MVAAEAGAAVSAKAASAAVPRTATCLKRATGYSSVRFGVGVRESNSLLTARQWLQADCGLAAFGHPFVFAGTRAGAGRGTALSRRLTLTGNPSRVLSTGCEPCSPNLNLS
ncbi:hypothetical protein GCM10009546_53820 [Actinomadura livida]|uniref:Secreted protein n=1 Tax=Actinomadura livida TaxID=79909 RepID=A0ABP3QAJ7_9ACTN